MHKLVSDNSFIVHSEHPKYVIINLKINNYNDNRSTTQIICLIFSNTVGVGSFSILGLWGGSGWWQVQRGQLQYLGGGGIAKHTCTNMYARMHIYIHIYKHIYKYVCISKIKAIINGSRFIRNQIFNLSASEREKFWQGISDPRGVLCF